MANPKNPTKAGRYDCTAIESRWQRYWAEHGTFRTLNPGEPGFATDKPKFYILDMFPYPSGSGLHVGHPVGYCATDIIARYKRHGGFNVLHPMGFDAFGLPAEQYAIEHNVHPAVTTEKNIERYRQQLRMFGFSYDWDRELVTSDSSFYKFTQWIFLKLFNSWYDEQCSWVDQEGQETVGRARPMAELEENLESGDWGVDTTLALVRDPDAQGRREWRSLSGDEKRKVLDLRRLAYIGEIPVNWCPELGTVLANEEVTNAGRSDRGNHPVFRRPLRQWMLRITSYADRLISDLGELDWPEPIKLMQRNWIGRSTGAEVVFPLAKHWRISNGQWVRNDASQEPLGQSTYQDFPDGLRVYTTRPDTLFGATYLVLAPDHEWVQQIATPEQREAVEAYVAATATRSELDRTVDAKEKTGVFTGAYAINPANGAEVPIWIADYVLASYGTGAIMAVPGGDTRDFEFACKFDLPIVCVNEPPESWIDERLAEITPAMDEAAKEGFDRIAEQFPELAEGIAASRKSSEALGAKTLKVLREKVGTTKLVAHYVKFPRQWGAAYAGEGIAAHSPGDQAKIEIPGGVCRLDGLATGEAKTQIIDWLERQGVGRAAVNYKLRDWIFSRQKYWGEPFPVLHGEDGNTIGLSDEDLPVELPEVQDFKPTRSADHAEDLPEPPLGRAKEWVTVTRNGHRYRRDLNTMPQWAGSCWYYLRFTDAKNEAVFCDSSAEKYWMPVDLYVGGAEHAVLHLLYARFWHKVLFDLGFVSTREPFRKLFNQGMIQGFAFRDGRGLVVAADLVEQRGEDSYVLSSTGEPVTRIVAKMSKSLKNVVSPDEIIADWGADTFRLYEMYMGPLDASKPWNTRDVPGLYKLCQRIWRLVVDEESGNTCAALTDDEPDEESLRALHKLIKRVTEDLDLLKFNTAITGLFDFVNFMTPCKRRSRAVIEPFVLVLSPFAPHLAEELWSRLGHGETLAFEPWPAFDEALTRSAEIEMAIQVNGKVKSRIRVAADTGEDRIKELALADERVASSLAGKTVRKVIVVKGRLVSVVAS